MARRKRPFLMTAIALWVAAVVLTLPVLGQLFNGVPLDQGLGPIGFVVGPLLAIGGTLLFFVKKPEPERPPEPLD
jgi:hypothetical protein